MKLHLLALAALCLTSCATIPRIPSNWFNAPPALSTSAVTKQAELTAVNTVTGAATSPADADTKANYLDSVAAGLRTLEGSGSIVSSAQVASVTKSWSPAGKQWAGLAVQLAQLYAKTDPRTPAAASSVLEAIATGLNATNSQP